VARLPPFPVVPAPLATAPPTPPESPVLEAPVPEPPALDGAPPKLEPPAPPVAFDDGAGRALGVGLALVAGDVGGVLVTGTDGLGVGATLDTLGEPEVAESLGALAGVDPAPGVLASSLAAALAGALPSGVTAPESLVFVLDEHAIVAPRTQPRAGPYERKSVAWIVVETERYIAKIDVRGWTSPPEREDCRLASAREKGRRSQAGGGSDIFCAHATLGRFVSRPPPGSERARQGFDRSH
jgi:hypothetical protein